MNTLKKTGLIFVVATTAALSLSACVSDGSYSSFSMGVSSYDGPRGYGYGYRGGRDFDGDGVPNWADRRPRNPWID
jgi:hypothetical protein